MVFKIGDSGGKKRPHIPRHPIFGIMYERPIVHPVSDPFRVRVRGVGEDHLLPEHRIGVGYLESCPGLQIDGRDDG